MHRTRAMLTAGLLASALALVACGGDDESSGASATPAATAAAGGSTVALSAPADGALKFDQAAVKDGAGTVTIDFVNPSDVPHAVEIEGAGIDKATDTVTKGRASVTVELGPGRYRFYCPVGNHRIAGMEGTLTVS